MQNERSMAMAPSREPVDGRFTGSRVTKTAMLHLDFSPARVFPLLCPERERDWIDGWDYTPVWSSTGCAEQDCVFTTDLPPDGFTVWVFSAYQPDRHLEVVRVTPGLAVLRWSMDLAEPLPGTTALAMTWVVTGLSAAGNRFIADSLDSRFSGLMASLERGMNHYLRTGKKPVAAC
jgi:hypothetical protein